jgi:hypothetical protein
MLFYAAPEPARPPQAELQDASAKTFWRFMDPLLGGKALVADASEAEVVPGSLATIRATVKRFAALFSGSMVGEVKPADPEPTPAKPTPAELARTLSSRECATAWLPEQLANDQEQRLRSRGTREAGKTLRSQSRVRGP